MLKVSSLVQDALRLILRIPPKLAVDIVCKDLVMSEVRPEKTLEFRPSNWSFFHRATFVLILLLGYHTMQKQGGKRHVVGFIDSGSFKVALTLLTKTVAVQVRISIIEIGKPGL